jgi:predicted enzyme related to lactoylglutathione lyase
VKLLEMRSDRRSTATNLSRGRHARFGRVWALLLVGCALVGCATGGTALPPITETATGEYQVGKFVWFDLLTEDPGAARAFYQGLFDWTVDNSDGPAGYFTIRHDGVAIGGIAKIENEIDASEAIWLGSLSVEDVDAAAKTTAARGGEVIDPPTDVGGRGRMAIIRDPSGAELGVLRSATGDPAESKPTAGRWLWTELVTDDSKTAEAFYAELVGYRVQTVETGDDLIYRVVGRDGRARAGIVEVEWKNVEPNWLPYVGVADLNTTIRSAYALGGRLLLRNGDIAILTDPTGGAIGIQQLAGGTK